MYQDADGTARIVCSLGRGGPSWHEGRCQREARRCRGRDESWYKGFHPCRRLRRPRPSSPLALGVEVMERRCRADAALGNLLARFVATLICCIACAGRLPIGTGPQHFAWQLARDLRSLGRGAAYGFLLRLRANFWSGHLVGWHTLKS